MFRWFAVPVVLALGLFLVSDSTVDAQKKKKGPTINGAVVNVEKGKDAGTATLTVKTPAKKNKKTGAVTEAKEHTIQVTKDTAVVKATGKKKEAPAPATVADIEKGQNVSVTISAEKAGVAERVLIQASKKKKNQ